MLIATSRKLHALGLLIAETKVTPESAGARTGAIRAVVAQIVALVGVVILGLYVVMLSSTFMPTFKVFLVLLVLAALIGWLLQRSFVKVYSLAQAALKETLSEAPAPAPAQAPKVLPSLLRDADLETVVIADGSAAIGKRIDELQIRAKSGANIVGIERQGASIINPPPDEELLVGDEVLLLGNRDQLDAARKELQVA
jgi:CPA2 family monovalent cation:H+ antiporter-2